MQHANAVQHPLHRPEIRNVDQSLLLGAPRRVGPVEIAVDKVMDHLNWLGHSEEVNRLRFKVPADRSDAVRLLDGELSDAKVRAVHANQCDVGSMQSEEHTSELQSR